MHPRRLAAALTAATAVVLVAACATQVDGKGTGAGPHAGPAASPAESAPAGSTPAGSTPAGSAPAPSTAAPSSSAGGHPVPDRPLREAVVHAGGATYPIKVWAQTRTTDCAAHAYGTPMVAFLHRHRCTVLTSLLATTTVGGRRVGFAQRSIGFRGAGTSSYRAAGAFRALVSRNGTGNLNDLLREGYRLPSGPAQVPLSNAFSAQSQDNGVTVVEAWYLHGPTPANAPALVRMEHNIFLQF